MVAWEAIAILVFAFTSNNANACSNALIGALASNQCTPWVAFHEVSIASMWIAAVVFTISALFQVLNRDKDSNGPDPA